MEIFHIAVVVFIVSCLILFPTVGLRIMKRNAALADPTKPVPKQGKLLKLLPFIWLIVGGTALILTRIIPLFTN